MPETVDRTGHPKMMPQPFSTQWDYPNFIFYSFSIKFVGSRPKTYYLIIPYSALLRGVKKGGGAVALWKPEG